jgi:hypothetical protein
VLNLCKKCQGIVESARAVLTYAQSYTQKTFFGPPQPILYTKTYLKTPKMNFCRLKIQEPIFSVSNTEFEGGDDGYGLGDCTFLVKQAQPSSHRSAIAPSGESDAGFGHL